MKKSNISLVQAPNSKVPDMMWILLGISITAFFYNISHYLIINFTSAHYSVIIGNVKTVLLVLLSIYLFNTQFSTLNIFGLFLSLAGFCAYNYYRWLETFTERDKKREKELMARVNTLLSTDYVPSDEEDENEYGSG